MPRKALAQRLPLDEPVLRPSFRRERRALNKGIFPIAGCDEAGGDRSPARWWRRRSSSILATSRAA